MITQLYFVTYHLFGTTVLTSLFVAVILDNLELDEETKRQEQLKSSTNVGNTIKSLPFRYRIFKSFPDEPELVNVKKSLPLCKSIKIRQSVMDNFMAYWDHATQNTNFLDEVPKEYVKESGFLTESSPT